MKEDKGRIMSQNIAIFNNATGVLKNMKTLFSEENLNATGIDTLNELLSLVRLKRIHLILVDIELDENGMGKDIEIIKNIRECTAVPIIVISAQIAEYAKIRALNVGADDYVTAYDSPFVLLARIKAQLRRYIELNPTCERGGDIYRIDDLVLDDSRHIVTVRGEEVKVTPIEYKILRLLIQEQGKVFSINEIYEKIWKMQAVGAENIIAVHIHHVREKIENNPQKPKYITVVRGLGYKVG